MEYVELNNGVMMPMVGFGTWDLRGESGRRAILDALDSGYRLIDTARMYGNEGIVGEAIRESSVPRDQVFVTTKIYQPCITRRKAAEAIDDSLRRMGLDYIDMVLVHEPYPTSSEMFGAIVDAVEEGKVRAVGVSNFDEDLCRRVSECGTVPAVNQVESHVYFPQLSLRDLMMGMGTVMQSWGPFTEGRMDIFNDPVLKGIAEGCGRTVAQVALRYLVQNGIPVIPKSSRRERMEENLGVLDFELSASDMKEISKLDGGRSLFGWYRCEDVTTWM